MIRTLPLPRLLSSLALRPARIAIQRQRQPSRLSVLQPQTHLRAFSRSALLNRNAPVDPKWNAGAKVEYAELKKITGAPNDDVLLIDVREPAEVTLGSIPSSVNLPLSSFEKSLSMDEGDFTRVHGFHKPTKDQPIIFYCRAGVRAQTALDLAKRQGYGKVRNYEGSWLEWEAKNANKANGDD